ncbi:c3HC zinc finger-like domain-containing protein [Ditylenchus destructor]|nr:c3HC zinc finger-like domain-containing protein [Ditylenchus destructor]
MKRKAEDNEDAPILLKSLRRSISDFIAENDAAAQSSKGAHYLDHTQECWIKYRERLATFKLFTMLDKPKELSPCICAKHGWKYSGDDLLECEECKKFTCIKIPKIVDISTRLLSLSVRNVQRKFVEAHEITCSWRTNKGLDVTLPYNILERYELLKDAINPVPLVPDVIEAKRLNQFNLENKFALISAICGWMPSRNKDLNRMECMMCGRDLCVLVFSEENRLNPLEQHHSFCPIVDKEFPVWRAALNIIPKIKDQPEPVVSSLARIKSTIKNLFKK